MGAAEATNTGKFNYHLKVLGDLIEKDANGRYRLTEKGTLVLQFLEKFPEKKSSSSLLHMSDAALIGFVGVVAAFINPIYLIGYALSAAGVHLPLAVLGFLFFFHPAYTLLVPGVLMWKLCLKRVQSHDVYDLFKPPFVAFMLLLAFVVTMYFGRIDVIVYLSTPPENGQWFSYHMIQISLAFQLLFGMVGAFVGVAIAEFAAKIRKRWR